MTNKVKPDQLAAAVQETLQIYAQATGDQLAATTKSTAEHAAQIVSQAAAAQYSTASGEYARDIKARNFSDTRKRGGRKITAFVTAGKHYRIAHLLEHGHALVRGGRLIGPTGRVEGRPHWIRGQEYVDRNFVPNLQKAIEEESK